VSECLFLKAKWVIFFSYIMARTSYNRSDDDVRFVLYQQAKLDLYSASWQFTETTVRNRHVAPLGHTNLIPGQSIFALKKILSNVWYDYDDLISCMYVNELHRWFSGLCVRLKPKTKIDICICCCSTKQAVLRSKSKYWLARNQVSVSKWSDMSIADCCFSELSTGTAKL
jgi:hypothetical protein